MLTIEIEGLESNRKPSIAVILYDRNNEPKAHKVQSSNPDSKYYAPFMGLLALMLSQLTNPIHCWYVKLSKFLLINEYT